MQSACEPPSRAVLTLESLSVYFCGKVFVSSTFHWSLARKVETTVFCCLNGRYTCLYSGGLPSPWSPGAALEGRNSPHWWAWKKMDTGCLEHECQNLSSTECIVTDCSYILIVMYTYLIHMLVWQGFFLKGVCSGPLSLGKDLWQVQVTHLWQWYPLLRLQSAVWVYLSFYLRINLGTPDFGCTKFHSILGSQHARTSESLALELQIPKKPCMYSESWVSNH